ncbi:MAG: DJ-1/PfpI family protein [Candidatus Cloacimonetes bacterium]|nr:DJ-1/PfpI family protein [Candidatus Cloacimonadota bacterium]
MSKKVLIPIADGTEELEFIGLADVLRRAGAEVTIASVMLQQITTVHGIKIVADCTIEDCINKEYDLIVLPGGMPGAEHLRDCKILIDLLKQQQEDKKLYGAICASPVIVLQSHGLLEGKQATAYPGMAESLKIRTAINKNVVIDNNCITSKGPGTVLKFALTLVEMLYGKQKSDELKHQMILD